MLTRLRWRLRTWTRSIWGPVIGFGILGVITPIAAQLVSRVLPGIQSQAIGSEAVDQLLGILAGSMLTVTTFSVSIMITAFSSASSGATPRALTLLQSDRSSRYVLGIFIGAFIYAISGIIGLNAELYNDAGKVVLFLVTIIVLAGIILALIRWIAHLTTFGRMSDTLSRAEAATADALKFWMAEPYLGGAPFEGKPPVGSDIVHSKKTGYVQHIDMEELATIAEAEDLTLYVDALPGCFIHPVRPLVHVTGLEGRDEDRSRSLDRLRKCFAIGAQRGFDQDPRFGISTLAEVASRALSPAVNDPGTATDVISRLVRVLGPLAEVNPSGTQRFPRIHIGTVSATEFLMDGFDPIARDGAALAPVLENLLGALRALTVQSPRYFGAGAAELASRVYRLGEAALVLEEDKAALKTLAAEIERLATPQPEIAIKAET